MEENIMNRCKLCFGLCLMSFLLCGCWDRIEIEDRAVVLGLSIDVEEQTAEEEGNITHEKNSFIPPKKEQIRITAQIAVPGRIPLGPDQGEGGETIPVWVVNVSGHTVDDAIMNLQQQVSDQLFFGHLRVIILSEAVAKRGIEGVNNFFRRNPEVRRLTWMMVAEGNASKIMEVAPPLERVPALYLLAALDHAVQMGKFPNDNLGVFWIADSSVGIDPYLPYIRIRNNNNIEIAGLAYFRSGKMVGATTPLEIGFFMAIKGMNPGGYSGFVRVPGTDDSVIYRATHRNASMHLTMKNGKPHFKVRMTIEGNLDEKSSEHFSLNEPGIIDQIEQEVKRQSTKAISSFIAATQKHGSDIFGFGEYVRAKAPAYWNRHIKSEEDWQETYKELEIELEMSFKVRRVGMTAT
jgi:spore germination protein KC